MNTATAAAPAALASRVGPSAAKSVIVRVAERYGVDSDKMLSTLKNTAFKVKGGEATPEQLMSLLVVADQYRLNPFLREVFAFPDKSGGIVPVVGVDGWARIINQHEQFDGMEFRNIIGDADELVAVECTMHRKDRSHPTKVTELLKECRRDTDPWKTHPARMLRHKSMIQCARIAFSFAGIFDEDEAERIIEGEVTMMPATAPGIDAINREVAPPKTVDSTSTDEFTFADVASEIAAALAAKSVEQLDLAADLLRQVKDPKHQTELAKQVLDARATLQPEGDRNAE